MGYMETRKHRELKDVESEKIYTTYHKLKNNQKYKDIEGFCKSATFEEIKSNDYILTPGRYVGIDLVEIDDYSYEEKMIKLAKELHELLEESKKLENKIRDNLRGIGYEL
jgi:type I restriction enzyme M protein